jgi:hypothetical protein
LVKKLKPELQIIEFALVEVDPLFFGTASLDPFPDTVQKVSGKRDHVGGVVQPPNCGVEIAKGGRTVSQDLEDLGPPRLVFVLWEGQE